ncbi:hypothetical protein ABTD92_20020, partial [Acinetobacter baumannii]
VPPPSPGHRPFSFAAPRLSGVASPHAALKRRAISPLREAMKKLVAAFAALLMINTQAAQAQSILRDAETESLFADMTRPIIVAAGLNPKDVRI